MSLLSTIRDAVYFALLAVAVWVMGDPA